MTTKIAQLEKWVERNSKKLDDLLRERESSELDGFITHLDFTIAKTEWWNNLTLEQAARATDVMKAANLILCRRLGLHLDLVTIERRD